MCTYGQAILEEGIAIGEGRGSEKKQRQLLLNFLSSGMSVEQVAAGSKVPVEYVRKLAEEIRK